MSMSNPWKNVDSPIKLLFSYGSNGIEQLRERTGADVTPYRGVLKNYVRIFAGYAENWRGGVASIRACPGKKVDGNVVEMTVDQLERLDWFEIGYRRVKKNVRVFIPGIGWKTVKCFVYIKNSARFVHPPSLAYLRAIRKNLGTTRAISIKKYDVEKKKIVTIGKYGEDGAIYVV